MNVTYNVIVDTFLQLLLVKYVITLESCTLIHMLGACPLPRIRVTYHTTVQDGFSVILFIEIMLVFGANDVFVNSNPSLMTLM